MSDSLQLAAPGGALSGTQRAAVVLLSLGEDQAAEVLKHLGAREVQKLGMAMTSISNVSRQQVASVFDDFVDTLSQPAAIGAGADDYVRSVLVQALGEDRASGLLDRILMGRNTSGLDTLKWMEPRAIADLIRNEHPQIVSIVMAHLEADQAAGVLKLLPDNVRADVLLRIATLDGIPPHALNELNDVMARQFSGNQMKTSTVGGVKLAGEILNFMDSGQDEAILTAITAVDEDLSTRIRDVMFVFDNLAEVDDRSMQTILRDVPNDKLGLALRGADPKVKDKILANMSQRAAEILVEDMEARGPVRLAEVEAAQKDILAMVRKLADDGTIQLGAQKEAFV